MARYIRVIRYIIFILHRVLIFLILQVWNCERYREIFSFYICVVTRALTFFNKNWYDKRVKLQRFEIRLKLEIDFNVIIKISFEIPTMLY